MQTGHGSSPCQSFSPKLLLPPCCICTHSSWIVVLHRQHCRLSICFHLFDDETSASAHILPATFLHSTSASAHSLRAFYFCSCKYFNLCKQDRSSKHVEASFNAMQQRSWSRVFRHQVQGILILMQSLPTKRRVDEWMFEKRGCLHLQRSHL